MTGMLMSQSLSNSEFTTPHALKSANYRSLLYFQQLISSHSAPVFNTPTFMLFTLYFILMLDYIYSYCILVLITIELLKSFFEFNSGKLQQNCSIYNFRG